MKTQRRNEYGGNDENEQVIGLMNVMNIISVVVFLLLAGGAIAAYRFLHREVEDSDGACCINELGDTGFSDEGDTIGKA